MSESILDDLLREKYMLSLRNQLITVQEITHIIKMDLEDDARIEDLQDRYKDGACEMLANALLMRININKILGDEVLVREAERVCDAYEALYRLVK